MRRNWMISFVLVLLLLGPSLVGSWVAEAIPFKGSQTEKNLMTAFAGESQARNRYTYYAAVAKEDGLEQIAAVFIETGENEREHAKIFLQLLKGGEISISAAYPAALSEKTLDNLEAAAAGEQFEWTAIYQNFAQAAKDEGFGDAAQAFTEVARVEKFHEARYRALIQNVKGEKVFQKGEAVKWHCRNCGYVQEGKKAPNVCPACRFPQAYFELLAENY